MRIAFHGRVEDEPLVRGRGRYVADAPLPNQAYAYFVRSPHAFARIVSIDTSGAANMPGVIGVLTAARTWTASAVFGRHPPVPGRTAASSSCRTGRRSPTNACMHIGEPVAMVVAETRAAAQDAGEFV